jgi:hypothetical protein
MDIVVITQFLFRERALGFRRFLVCGRYSVPASSSCDMPTMIAHVAAYSFQISQAPIELLVTAALKNPIRSQPHQM